MTARPGETDGRDNLRLLVGILKYVSLISAALAVVVAAVATHITFHLNRAGEYCNYYEERFFYYAGDNCYIELAELFKYFVQSLYLYYLLFFAVFVAASLVGFSLYLLRHREPAVVRRQ